MPRVAASQLLPHLRIRPLPEAPQVARRLHGASVRREQQQKHRLPARADARRLGQPEQLLQFDRRRDGAVVAIVERGACVRSARPGVRALRAPAASERPMAGARPGRCRRRDRTPAAACATSAGMSTSAPTKRRRRSSCVVASSCGRDRYASASSAAAADGSGVAGRFGQAQRVVPVDARRADAALHRSARARPRRAVGASHSRSTRWRQTHRASPPAGRAGCTSSATSTRASRTPLSRASSAPAPEASSRRAEPGSRRLADAVGIAREQRAAKLGLVDVLARSVSGHWRASLQQLIARLPERRRLLRPRVERRQQIARRRAPIAARPRRPSARERAGRAAASMRRAPATRTAPGAGAAAGREPFAERGQPAVVDRAESARSSAARRRALGGGASNHSNVAGSAAPGQDVEHAAPARSIAWISGSRCGRRRSRLVPEPDGDARPEAAGAARALVGRVLRDALEDEAVEAAVRRRSAAPCAGRCRRRPYTPGTVSEVSAMLVARMTRRPAGRKRRVLLRRRRAIRAAATTSTPGDRCANVRQRAANLRRARQEAQHAARRPREHAVHGRGRPACPGA